MNARKIALAAALAALVAAFFLLDLGRFLTLDHLASSRTRFQALYADHAALMLGAYFGLYALMAALSLPGAAVMSLAGAALFGFWPALVAVSFASTLGATAACAVSRFLLRDWVQGRFGPKLKKVNAGVAREGAFYLFTLRLIPVFPFVAVNLVMGLTPMRLWTFYWVSQLGMLPGTAVYVNAGTRLGEIDSLAGIISWPVLGSFVLLGLFPLPAKMIVRAVRTRSARSGRRGKPGRPENLPDK